MKNSKLNLLVEMRNAVIGVDAGGTKTTTALATEDGYIIKMLREQTPTTEGAQAGYEVICVMIQNLINEAVKFDFKVTHIGVGFGGPVDFKHGIVYLSHHVEGWENFPLKEKLETKFGIPTIIDNDANAGTIAEWMFGAGKGMDNLIYVNIGTGIGGGIISDGKLLRGWKNLAGEIGHITVKPDGPNCTCGRKGCLEAFSSGSAISYKGTLYFGKPLKSEEVFQLAQQGNQVANKIIQEAVDMLAFALGAVINLINPQLIIIGGGVADAPENLLLEPLRKKLPEYTLPESIDGLKIIKAKLGYDAGVIGAIALALLEKNK